MNTQSTALTTQDDARLAEDAMPIEPSRASQWLLYIIAGLVAFTIIWASVAKLDRVVRGQGRVVTSNQLQELQYLEGGIVKEILVSAGETVEAGQVLVKLDPTQMSVEYIQGQEGFNLLAARIARLEAEAALKPLTLSAQLESAAPSIAANERALFRARREELNASMQVEQTKLGQRQQTLADAEVSFLTADEAFNLAAEELSMM
ncbi:MAG: hypothetical protein AAGC77_11390, partial [Pseudomonadota bacterium]